METQEKMKTVGSLVVVDPAAWESERSNQCSTCGTSGPTRPELVAHVGCKDYHSHSEWWRAGMCVCAHVRVCVSVCVCVWACHGVLTSVVRMHMEQNVPDAHGRDVPSKPSHAALGLSYASSPGIFVP